MWYTSAQLQYIKATFCLIVTCLQEINAQTYEILTLNLTGVPSSVIPEAPSKPATQNIQSVLGKARDCHVKFNIQKLGSPYSISSLSNR